MLSRGLRTIAAGICLAGTAACPDDKPTPSSSGTGTTPPPTPMITVAAECPQNQLTVNPHVTKTQNGGNYVVRFTIDIKCNGQPVQGRVIVSLGSWWPNHTFNTDANGHISDHGPAKAGD